MYSIAVRQYTFNVGPFTFAHDYLVLLDDQGNVVGQFHGQPTDPSTGQPISGAVGRSTVAPGVGVVPRRWEAYSLISRGRMNDRSSA